MGALPEMQADSFRPVSVLVVEPFAIWRRAILHLLREAGAGLGSIGAVDGVAASVELAGGAPPDVVVVATIDPEDYHLVRGVIERIPGARVVVLSLRSDYWAIAQAFREGAAGFVPRWARPEILLEALDAVSRGETFVHAGNAGLAGVG
jgi:DNA-binding NarL/FixJ family response regulator